MTARSAIKSHPLARNKQIPNSPLPLLAVRQGLPLPERSGAAARRLLQNAGWTGTWIYTVFPFWHFHTRGHEVLACVSGEALIGFGGNGRLELPITIGDVVLIPAGVGHKRLSGTDDFQVAGAYPPGQQGDIVRPGELSEEAIASALGELPLPQTDPLDGGVPGMIVAWIEAAR